VYTGEEALKLGLADEIGNFYKSFEYALKRTGLKRANIVYYPEKKGFLKRLMESKLSLKPRELIYSFTIKALYLFSY
ncbi:MAG: signal peptide peptidase SppA, partial [Thermodesulfobacteriaceae bacterium]|nr:signal peptide peptidase SppA [Thermodesulfobacteriaceae bacterium]